MNSSNKTHRRNAVIASLSFLTISTLFLDAPTNQIRRATTAYNDSFSNEVATNLGDVTSPLQKSDTPVYWHIPKSGGTSMKGYYSCMGLVEASEKGVIGHSNNEPELRIHEHQGTYYLNVDTTKKEGAIRAANLKLAESGLADIVFTPFRFASTTLFSPSHQGRLFTLFRHPIDRAVSLFYYRQVATWEERPGVYRPDLEGMDIDTWIQRGDFEDHVDYIYGHYVVASLVGKGPMDVLTDEDLEQAKQILKEKFVVGLVSQMEESVKRFDFYFGWDQRERADCYDEYIVQGLNKNTHKHVVEGSDTWKVLDEMAYYDIQLYEYAVELFEEQGREIFDDGTVYDGDAEEEEENSRRTEGGK